MKKGQATALIIGVLLLIAVALLVFTIVKVARPGLTQSPRSTIAVHRVQETIEKTDYDALRKQLRKELPEHKTYKNFEVYNEEKFHPGVSPLIIYTTPLSAIPKDIAVIRYTGNLISSEFQELELYLGLYEVEKLVAYPEEDRAFLQNIQEETRKDIVIMTFKDNEPVFRPFY